MPGGLQLPPLDQVGVIVVDHGSRREASNQMLLEIVVMFQRHSGYTIVEPAHMELAEPSIGTAFARCVERGARLVVVHPYFLLPGRHWDQDIPALTGQAADAFPDVPFLVTQPLGRHQLMAEIMAQRIGDCLEQAGDWQPSNPNEGEILNTKLEIRNKVEIRNDRNGREKNP